MATADSQSLDLSAMSADAPRLLIVVGEAFTLDHQQQIIKRLSNELLSWDIEAGACDINQELQALAAQSLTGTDGLNGEKIIEYSSGAVHIVIVINPTLKTLIQRLRTFLGARGSYRHLIHAGSVIQGSGCWVLQDAVFTFRMFQDLLRGSDVSQVLECGLAQGVFNLNVFAEREWTNVAKQMPQLQVSLNRSTKEGISTSALIQFITYIQGFLQVESNKQLLKYTDFYGNIHFNRPTLYIFPAGNGNSALFGINGCNLLIDGGYSRRPCFWNFTKHLERIDALLITHIGADNLFGIGSVLARKAADVTLHPDIGCVFLNTCAVKPTQQDTFVRGAESSKVSCSRSDGLLLNMFVEATSIVNNLHTMGIVPHPLTASASGPILPLTLYRKVGQGSLELYTLNPLQDSKVLNEFMSQWSKQGDGLTDKNRSLPLSHATSICAVLVWKPASHNEKITRILIPGGATQAEVFQGLNRLNNVNLFQHANCSETVLSSPLKCTSSLVNKGIHSQKAASKLQPPTSHNTVFKLQATTSQTTASMLQKPSSSCLKKNETQSGNKSLTCAPTSNNNLRTDLKKGIVAKQVQSVAHTVSMKSMKNIKQTQTRLKKIIPADVLSAQPELSKLESLPSETLSATTMADTKRQLVFKQYLMPDSEEMDSNNESMVKVAAPVIEAAVPVAEADTLLAEATAPVIEAAAPVVGAAAPVIEAATPVVGAAAPVIGAARAVAEATVPVVEATAPVAEVVAPEIEVAAPVVEAAAAVVQEAAPVLEAAPSVIETAAYITQAAAPVVDATATVIEAATPVAEAAPHVTEAAAPVVDISFETDVCNPLEQSVDNSVLQQSVVMSDSFSQSVMHLSRSDSLDDSSVRELPKSILREDLGMLLHDIPAQPTNNLLDMTSLQTEMWLNDLSKHNQFIGMSDVVSSQDIGSFEEGSGKMTDENLQQYADEDLDRDSLERESPFDPSQWDQPMGLPAPNRLPRSENSKPGQISGGVKIGTLANVCSGRDQGLNVSVKNSSVASLSKKPGTQSNILPQQHKSPSKDSDQSAVKSTTNISRLPTASATKKQSNSTVNLKPVAPFYVDLAYIPRHGSAEYVDECFFHCVRARYYVLSALNPDPRVLNDLLEAKAMWDNGEVTIIPTYESDMLRCWIGAHRDVMNRLKIDVAPAVNRCSIQLQEQEASCTAFRLEF